MQSLRPATGWQGSTDHSERSSYGGPPGVVTLAGHVSDADRLARRSSSAVATRELLDVDRRPVRDSDGRLVDDTGHSGCM
jgi:hypothetical protein